MTGKEDNRISLVKLKEVLYYDEFTGIFTWINTNSNKRKAGSRAGSVEAKNYGKAYIYIRLCNRVYRGHTLACFYMTGHWPDGSKRSPHRNDDGTDNRWENLALSYEREIWLGA